MTDFSGKTIGEYQLLELIYDTSTSVVLKSFQPSMNRYVAVEVLKPSAAGDAATSQQFLGYGEIASRLQHPNLMPVYDSGQESGMVYRAMPLMPGGRLADHLADYRDPNMASELVKQIEGALGFIHSQGYIHGNLNPENIYFDENRRPVLVGFGFSQRVGGTITPYMSPEQVKGGVVDGRTDIYALGILLYAMLAGQAPPAGAVVSLRTVRPDLPQELEMLILKAVAQNPDQRFQTPSEFSSSLEAGLRAPVPPPVPTPAPAPYTSAPQPPAKKGTNWLGILLGGALIIALCLCVYLVGPQVMEYLSGPTAVVEAPPAPTEPQPGVTVVLPTREEEPRPTRPPAELPTQPAEQPTQPPEGGAPELPGICGSAGFIGGSAIFGSIIASRKRKKRGPGSWEA